MIRIVFAGLLAALGVAPAAAVNVPEAAAVGRVFDFGAEDLVAPGADAVGVGTGPQGFHWTTPPEAVLDREALARSRDALTRDSVVGGRIGAEIDLPAGRRLVAFWVEAGREDASSLEVAVDGAPIDLDWHAFDPRSEPREDLRAELRLGIAPVELEDARAVKIDWRARGDDSVRLAALNIVPMDGALPANLRAGVAALGDVARGARPAIAALLAEAEKAYAKDQANGALAALVFRLRALAWADLYYEGLRGWERSRRDTGLTMFDRYYQSAMLLDGLLADPTFEESGLYDRALYMRARLQYWLWREQGGPNARASAERDFDALVARGIETPLIAMYRGARIEADDPCDALADMGAPAWAVRQNEILCRTRHIAHWWIDERQAPNGELGGKLGDDVEMTRWWTMPLVAGDARTAAGWARLAEAVWSSEKLVDGYYKAPIDVEHAAEPLSDTAVSLAFSGDVAVRDRLFLAKPHFTERWTTPTGEGRRLFRAAWFGAYEIDARPPRDRDVPMNARAVKGLRYAAFLSRDPSVLDPLTEWSRAWRDIAARDDKGKPAGVVPPSVRASDGAINGDLEAWWDPQLFWRYFDWKSSKGLEIYDQLLFTAMMTGDRSFVEPIETAARLVIDLAATSEGSAAAEGSAAWAAATLADSGGFFAILEQWRLLTNDPAFDELLARRGGAYIRYRLSGDEAALADAGEPIVRHLRVNEPLLTSEALFTDRVDAAGPGEGDSYRDVIGMLTGGMTMDSPYFAVTWEDAAPGFTALVAAADDRTLSATLFPFAAPDETAATTQATARLWRLSPGRYRMRVANGVADMDCAFDVTEPGDRAPVRLAVGRVNALAIAPATATADAPPPCAPGRP